MDKDERDQLMVDMRKDGMSYRQIAEATGVSHPTVMSAVNGAGGKNLPPDDLPSTVTGADGKQYPASRQGK